MSKKVPEFQIKTSRLEIVAQGMRFFATTHAYASDAHTMRYMVFLPNESPEETKQFLQDAEREWQKEIPAYYECAILHGGTHIGGISLYPDKERRSAELGWCLAKEAQGNGYALEAAAALVCWAKDALAITRFVAHCDSGNAASWKTMERLGMRRVSCSGGRHNKSNPAEERTEYLYELDAAEDWHIISRFDMRHIPLVMETVMPLWGPPGAEERFRRLYVEYIIRNNIYEPAFSYQLTDGNREDDCSLLAAAFFARKSDHNTAQEWLAAKAQGLTARQRLSLSMGMDYLAYMDKKTLSFMHDDDIKLSLFISRKKGCGAALLAKVLETYRADGYKNIWLWTDSECNWRWYGQHGYEMVSEECYEPFSRGDAAYKSFIFRKTLS